MSDSSCYRHSRTVSGSTEVSGFLRPVRKNLRGAPGAFCLPAVQALNGSKEEGMTSPWMAKLWGMVLGVGFGSLCLVGAHAFQASSTGSPPAAITERNGAHDFDFL